jgi:hypothetical protein
MSQIDRLKENYERFVRLPWQKSLAGSQRVWFAVYPPSEERRLRAKIQEFEMATRDAKHSWHPVDITDEFAQWMGSHEYRDDYFAEPEALATVEEELRDHIVARLKSACESVDDDSVIAVLGAGTLFGFTHISSVVSALESSIRGRLLVFFPGEYERNLYRFMDARDGFNYMAVPITCGEMIKI